MQYYKETNTCEYPAAVVMDPSAPTGGMPAQTTAAGSGSMSKPSDGENGKLIGAIVGSLVGGFVLIAVTACCLCNMYQRPGSTMPRPINDYDPMRSYQMPSTASNFQSSAPYGGDFIKRFEPQTPYAGYGGRF